MTNPSFLLSLFVFCLIAAGVVALFYAFFGGNRVLEERFNDLAVKIRTAQGVFDDDDDDDTFGRMLLRWAAARVPTPDVETPAGEKLQQTLRQAGFRSIASPHTFNIVRVCLVLGTATVGALIAIFLGKPTPRIVTFALMGGMLGFFGPMLYIQRRARARQTAIARQLSDVLDLLVVCVEAGLGLHEAIRIVGKESLRHTPEIGHELSLVSAEITAGASMGQALRSLAERTDVEDIKPLAATLIQSEQLGTQIGPALHASADALRTRRRLRAEEAAQKTTVKMLFPLVIFVLPAMLMVIVGPAVVSIIRTL